MSVTFHINVLDKRSVPQSAYSASRIQVLGLGSARELTRGLLVASNHGRVAMSEKTEKFLGMAMVCRRKAELAHDPDVKQQFLELARYWQHLAEQSDRVRFVSQPISKPDE